MDLTIEIIILILLLYSAYTDIRSREIMMLPVYICILIAIIGVIAKGDVSLMSFLGAIPGLIMLLVSHITKGALGDGDAYLILAVGLLIGLRNVTLMLMIGSTMAFVYSLFLLSIKKAGKKKTICYAPFILSGFIGVMIIG